MNWDVLTMELSIVKISTFIFLSLLSINLFALNTERKIHFFVYDQNGKVLDLKEVILINSKIVVEGQELSDTEVILKSKFLRPLMTKGEEKVINCDSGKFILKVSEKEKSAVETGCLGTKRFSEIYNSFKKLRKDVVLK